MGMYRCNSLPLHVPPAACKPIAASIAVAIPADPFTLSPSYLFIS
jgi:hypothetical protein